MPNLLHIASDQKFIDPALELFDAAAPDSNTLVVRLPHGRTKPTMVKRVDRVTLVHDGLETLEKLLAELSEYDAVVLHGLDPFGDHLVAASRPHTRFLWLAWGFDIYKRYPIYSNSLYQPATRHILRQLEKTTAFSEVKSGVKSVLFRSALPAMNGLTRCLMRSGHLGACVPGSDPLKNSLRCIGRLSACATVLPDEWPTVRQLGFRGQFLRFNYAWLEQLFPAQPLRVTGANILVGNSSTPACNHVDMFRTLSRQNLNGASVIVPLSYGNNEYKQHVLRHGRALLGKAFVPLEDLMPLHEYHNVLESCGTVIMNHHRQQAVGNIIAALYMGARVFLNDRNPCHSFFSRTGARLFSLQRDGDRLARTDDVISDATLEHNRECLRSEYCKDVSLERTRKIVTTLLS